MAIIEHFEEKPSVLGKILKIFLVVFFIVGVFLLIIYFRVQTKYSDNIYEPELLPSDYGTALVFGAGLKARGTPGQILEDRILTSIELYQLGKAETILMSGDNSQANHNEVQAMKNLAIKEGVPEDIIIMDHSGVSTLVSCQQAKNNFGLDKVILVTQEYHLKRALYVCNEAGLQAVGVAAGQDNYRGQIKFTLREIVASVVDWFEVKISN